MKLDLTGEWEIPNAFKIKNIVNTTKYTIKSKPDTPINNSLLIGHNNNIIQL